MTAATLLPSCFRCLSCVACQMNPSLHHFLKSGCLMSSWMHGRSRSRRRLWRRPWRLETGGSPPQRAKPAERRFPLYTLKFAQLREKAKGAETSTRALSCTHLLLSPPSPHTPCVHPKRLCVHSRRLRGYRQNAHMCLNLRTCCQYTRGRFECNV